MDITILQETNVLRSWIELMSFSHAHYCPSRINIVSASRKVTFATVSESFLACVKLFKLVHY